MISRRFSEYPKKPNFRAGVYIYARGIARAGAAQLFSYLGYYFFYYISEGYDPLPPKAERDSRTVSWARDVSAARWEVPA